MLSNSELSEHIKKISGLTDEKIFFAGIGGISMSAIAEYLFSEGIHVCGYDANRSEMCRKLSDKGIEISYEFTPEMFEGVGLAVFTNAIHHTDKVYAYPKSHGIKCITRAEMLGMIMLGKKNRIGIAGTHGKSSTTGMISSIMLAAGRDPDIFVGAELDMINGTHRKGDGEDFIFEACEYMDSFLSFYPTVSVVMNTELDHVDYFGNIENVIKSFARYMDIPGKDGFALINADCENTLKAAENCIAKAVAFSVRRNDTDYYADNIASNNGFFSFDFNTSSGEKTRIALSIPGEVYVTDALAACSCAKLLGVGTDEIKKGIKAYHGVKRRFEPRGRCGKAFVVDDYAHHPDEIKATLATARSMGFKNITCVYQPHTYTRTEALFDDFVNSFISCDKVIFADIYAAREEPIEGIDAKALAKAAPNGEYVGNMDDIAAYLKSSDMSEDSLIIVMGAGDIIKLTDMILTEKTNTFFVK